MIASLLIFLIFLILPFRVPELRQRPIVLIYFIALFSREIFTLIHLFIFQVPGVGPDYADYHFAAEQIAQTGNWNSLSMGQFFYENFLALFYYFFESSIILGFQLSIAMFAASFIFFIKILDLIELGKYKNLSLIIFSLLPSSILLTSVTMPESGQLLFFLIATYYGIRFIENSKYFDLFLLVIFASIMSFFHKGLLPFAFLLFLATIFFRFKHSYDKGNFSNSLFIKVSSITLITFGIFSILIYIYGTRSFGALDLLINKGPLEYIEWYRSNAHNTRATYGKILDTDSLISTYTTLIMMIIHYLYEPFFWKVDRFIDLYANFESLLRAVFTISTLSLILYPENKSRNHYIYLLVLYFLIASIWSFGTTNYGTSIRHNITHNWIIIVLGSYGVGNFIKQFLKKINKNYD